MKSCLRRLALSALLVSTSTVAYGQSLGKVGDLAGFDDGRQTTEKASYSVGDLMSVGDSMLADNYSQPEFQVGDLNSNVSQVATLVAGNSPSPLSYSDVSVGDMQGREVVPVANDMPVFNSCDCGPGSISACDAPGCRAGHKRRSIGARSDLWLTAEALLWFPQARNSPALITTANSGLAPTVGLPTTEVVFGGDESLGGDLSPGFRLDAGRYLTEEFGIGGRFWFLGENEESYSSGTQDGSSQSIGRPFFNTNTSGNDSILVAANNNFTGSITAESTLDLIAAEAYGRLKFAKGNGYRTDLIGGYSYFGIEDMLSVNSTAVEVNPATGRTIVLNDLFDAQNDFHGGQIGFETVLSHGKWMLTTLTKMHLGNMNQQMRIAGSSDNAVPPATSPGPGGGLALDNVGNYERDEFTFAPEANVKLGYRFRQNVLFTVGYSFLYWDSVALAGEHVDPVFDGTTLTTAGPFGQAPFSWKDSSFYVQGIDLGLVIDF